MGFAKHSFRQACLRLMLLLLTSSVWAPVAAAATGDLGGLELSAQVRRQLWRLQSSWQQWTRAYLAGDRAAADAELEQIHLIADHLGMSRMPDLSNAAAAYAVRAAQNGDFANARWALEAATALDAERPETEFARSTLAKAQGDYLGAVTAVLAGYRLQAKMPLAGGLLLHNAGLWLLYTLLVSGALFVVLMMLCHGSRLFYDLARLYSPPLQRSAGDFLTVILLIWPVFLPSGFLWLALYWSILLWGYGAGSERVVLILVWVLLGVTPVLLSWQQQMVRTSLVPPARLIENLSADRLYGGMFSDLEVLRSLVPEDSAVTEIVADLHRRLGQWEYARAIYTELAQDPDERAIATAYCNIGVYHHLQGDYATAVNYFKRATDADSTLTQAFYNLSQAHSQLYDFEPSHRAMAQAKALDDDAVERWNDRRTTAEESAVAVDGGLRRVRELYANLGNLWNSDDDDGLSIGNLWRRHRSLSATLAAILLAVTLHQLRSQVGYRSNRLGSTAPSFVDNRWLRALIPGMASIDEERGLLAFLAVFLPTGLVMILFLEGASFRPPLAYEAGSWLITLIVGAALALLWLIRLAQSLSSS